MTDPLAGFPPEAIALLRRHNLLRDLVEREVIDELVGTAPLTPEERESARRQFLQGNGIADENALRRFLEANALTPADLDRQIEMPMRIRRVSQERFGSKAEARFLERKEQLDRVVYSLLRVKDAHLARELYFRIAAGEATFAELAALHAEGPEKTTRGIVGPAPLTQAHPVLSERLRTSRPGVLQEPFLVADWWLIVRLEDFSPATFDGAMAAQMAGEMFSESVRAETMRRMARLSRLEPQNASSAPA